MVQERMGGFLYVPGTKSMLLFLEFPWLALLWAMLKPFPVPAVVSYLAGTGLVAFSTHAETCRVAVIKLLSQTDGTERLKGLHPAVPLHTPNSFIFIFILSIYYNYSNYLLPPVGLGYNQTWVKQKGKEHKWYAQYTVERFLCTKVLRLKHGKFVLENYVVLIHEMDKQEKISGVVLTMLQVWAASIFKEDNDWDRKVKGAAVCEGGPLTGSWMIRKTALPTFPHRISRWRFRFVQSRAENVIITTILFQNTCHLSILAFGARIME